MSALTVQDEFRSRHPEWEHRDVPFSKEQVARLGAAWRAMLDSQNGRDVDECAPGAMATFLANLPLRPPGRMLVVGAGTGVELAEVRALGWDVTGVTLGPMNVAVAAERGIAEDFADFHFSDYPTASFDAVVGRQVWEHSWSPFLFAVECARVLRPGGRVALETPCSAEFSYESHVIHHVHCPTPFQGARLLEKAGFVDVQVLDGKNAAASFRLEDVHRGDVGGGSLQFVGTRWRPEDSERVNPLVREMTSAALSKSTYSEADTRRVAAVTAIYREVLGREPDDRGLNAYVNSALSIDEVRAAVSSSQEARRRRGLARK